MKKVSFVGYSGIYKMPLAKDIYESILEEKGFERKKDTFRKKGLEIKTEFFGLAPDLESLKFTETDAKRAFKIYTFDVYIKNYLSEEFGIKENKICNLHLNYNIEEKKLKKVFREDVEKLFK